MPSGYCENCKKYVEIIPTSSPYVGGVKIHMQGPVDMIVPIKNQFQSHACPLCGRYVPTAEQKARSESSNIGAKLGFGLLLLLWIAGILYISIATRSAEGAVMFGVAILPFLFLLAAQF